MQCGNCTLGAIVHGNPSKYNILVKGEKVQFMGFERSTRLRNENHDKQKVGRNSKIGNHGGVNDRSIWARIPIQQPHLLESFLLPLVDELSMGISNVLTLDNLASHEPTENYTRSTPPRSSRVTLLWTLVLALRVLYARIYNRIRFYMQFIVSPWGMTRSSDRINSFHVMIFSHSGADRFDHYSELS